MLLFYLSALDTEEEQRDFAEYYSKNYGRCLAVANAITKNHAWAEEAIHNAVVRIIEQKEKYFDDVRKKKPTTFVIIVKGESLNILKREKKLDHVLLDDVEPIIASNTPDVFRIVEGKEMLRRVEQFISQLDEVNQILYEMRYIKDLKEYEIAEIVGISSNAVATRILRMRKSLAKVLKEEGYLNG